MNIDDFGAASDYLKASDLQGRKIELTIEQAERVDINGDDKLVLSFAGKDKQLVMNVTNLAQVASNLGTKEIEQWYGHKITIFPTTCPFEGRIVDCIRVEPTAPPAPAAAADDIPF